MLPLHVNELCLSPSKNIPIFTSACSCDVYEFVQSASFPSPQWQYLGLSLHLKNAESYTCTYIHTLATRLLTLVVCLQGAVWWKESLGLQIRISGPA